MWSWATRGIDWQKLCDAYTHTHTHTHTHLRGQTFSFICWICPLWVGVSYAHCVVQRCLEISVSWWEIFQKSAGTVGWTHSPTRGRPNSAATNIYCLSQRGNNDWLVKGMCIRCFMCSAHTISQNVQVLCVSAKLDCGLFAVKTTTLTCAVNWSQAERNVYKKRE